MRSRIRKAGDEPQWLIFGWKGIRVFKTDEAEQPTLKKRETEAVPTVPLAMVASLDVARELVSLYDAWVATLPYAVKSSVEKLRTKIAEHDAAAEEAPETESGRGQRQWMHVGASVPQWLLDDIAPHQQKYRRTRNYILSWILEQGIKHVTLHRLTTQYADLKPTMSLIVVAALKCGWQLWEQQYGVIKYPGRLDSTDKRRHFWGRITRKPKDRDSGGVRQAKTSRASG